MSLAIEFKSQTVHSATSYPPRAVCGLLPGGLLTNILLRLYTRVAYIRVIMTNSISPFDGMDRLFDQMRQSMLGFEAGMGVDRSRGDWMGSGMSVRMEETEDGIVVVADVPGFETEELDVRIDDGYLTIVGSHEVSEGASYHQRSVHEQVAVPETVRIDDIEADYHNGVLEIHLPVETEDEDEGGHRIQIE